MIETTSDIFGSTVTYFLNLMRTNLSDVSTPTAKGISATARDATSDWVVSSFPKPKKYKDFPGYPIVIVETPTVNETMFTMKHVKQKSGSISFIILDKSTNNVNSDNLAGQIRNVINSNITTIMANGIAIPHMTDSGVTGFDSGSDTIVRRIEYSFIYRNLDRYC